MCTCTCAHVRDSKCHNTHRGTMCTTYLFWLQDVCVCVSGKRGSWVKVAEVQSAQYYVNTLSKPCTNVLYMSVSIGGGGGGGGVYVCACTNECVRIDCNSVYVHVKYYTSMIIANSPQLTFLSFVRSTYA